MIGSDEGICMVTRSVDSLMVIVWICVFKQWMQKQVWNAKILSKKICQLAFDLVFYCIFMVFFFSFFVFFSGERHKSGAKLHI